MGPLREGGAPRIASARGATTGPSIEPDCGGSVPRRRAHNRRTYSGGLSTCAGGYSCKGFGASSLSSPKIHIFFVLDCGLRPEECYRLRWEHVRANALHIPYGKTANARRSIPLSKRAEAALEMRRPAAASDWVFAAPTKSGHIEQSTLRKQHEKACTDVGLAYFPFYTFRHTCLTKWSQHMDPYTLAYRSRRDGTGRRGRGWAQFWAHSGIDEFRRQRTRGSTPMKRKGLCGTPERIRTSDLLLRRQTLYPG